MTGPGAGWASPTSAVSLGFASGSPRAVSLFSGLGFFRSPVLEPYKESHLVVPMLSPGTLDLHLSSPPWLQLAPPSPCPKLIQTNSSRAQWGPWEEKGVKHLYWVYISQNTWKTVYRTPTPPALSPPYLGLHLPVSFICSHLRSGNMILSLTYCQKVMRSLTLCQDTFAIPLSAPPHTGVSSSHSITRRVNTEQ